MELVSEAHPMVEYSTSLFCSLKASVTGIKFYEGQVHLQSLMYVEFEREFGNPYDSHCSGEACPFQRPVWCWATKRDM